MKRPKIIVIGSGFAGLACATSLAQFGYDVQIIEKNDQPGGRARKFEKNGFVFDMGPSWYWMPDVFETYFNRFGKKSGDYYQLSRLDPSYQVFFSQDDSLNIPADFNQLVQLFEQIEAGSGELLRKFLLEAAYKYEVGINKLVYKPGRSLTEFMSFKLLYDLFRLDLFTSFHKHIRKFFQHEKLLQLMEFPILFLGATSEKTPALYSLMNHADMNLGTWYPQGGMHKIIEGMVALAKEKGVKFNLNETVTGFDWVDNKITAVKTSKGYHETEVVVAGADYHHVEQHLIPERLRTYTQNYWDKRVMAPSALIYYVGIDKKLNNLLHHNLFFDEDFKVHSHQIYENPQWPEKPLFYVCVPSKTDRSVAPEGHENLFFLMPVAPNLDDNEQIREKYFNLMLDRLESLTRQSVRENIVYKKSYAHSNFVSDYNSFKGNAYGLANTLKQTALLKPSLKSKKVNNLFYTGQLTVPGPGVPPSLISGQVAASEVDKFLK